MTQRHDWLFQKEDDFYHQAEIQVDFYDQNKEFLEILSADVLNLKAEFQKYKSSYELYLAGNKSATKPDTIKRNEQRKKVIELLRLFYNLYVRLNPKIKSDVREANYFPVFDNQKTSIHVPEAAPDFEIDFSVSPVHKIAFGKFNTKNKITRGLPLGATGVEVRRKMGVEQKPLAEDMEYYGVAARSPIKIVYATHFSGTKVWYAIRYYNEKGEYGLWSEVKSAIIN
jgi:hypothetical protein